MPGGELKSPFYLHCPLETVSSSACEIATLYLHCINGRSLPIYRLPSYTDHLRMSIPLSDLYLRSLSTVSPGCNGPAAESLSGAWRAFLKQKLVWEFLPSFLVKFASYSYYIIWGLITHTIPSWPYAPSYQCVSREVFVRGLVVGVIININLLSLYWLVGYWGL